MFPGVMEKSLDFDEHIVWCAALSSGSQDKVADSSTVPSPISFMPLSSVNSSLEEPNSGASKLRKMLLQSNELIVCPGVYDGLSARTAIELGFNAMYMVRDGRPHVDVEIFAFTCVNVVAYRLAPVPLLRVLGNPTWGLLSSTTCAITPT